MKDRIVQLDHGLFLSIRNSGEKKPIGVIIDLYKGKPKNAEFQDETWTLHYEDFS